MQVPSRTTSATATFFHVPVRANETHATNAIDQRGRLLADLAAHAAPRGYRIAYDLLGDRAEAEEAVQDALAAACESIASLREEGAAHGWFLRIVTNGCLRILRRRKLRRAVFGRLFARGPADPAFARPAEAAPALAFAAGGGGDVGDGEREDGESDGFAPGDDAAAATPRGALSDKPDKAPELGAGMIPSPLAPSPRDALLQAQQLAGMMRCLDGLPVKQRAAVLLRYGHELSVAEIADLLGVEPATAKTHLVRGLVRLRELMEEHP